MQISEAKFKSIVIRSAKAAMEELGADVSTIDLADKAIEITQDTIEEKYSDHDWSCEDDDTAYQIAFGWLAEHDIGKPE